MKVLLKLALVLLVGHALFRFVPPYWRFTEFEKDVKEQAIGWHEHPDAAVVQEVLALAAAQGVPIAEPHVEVRRERDHLYIDIEYVEAIEFIPGARYDWRFAAAIDSWKLTRQEIRVP